MDLQINPPLPKKKDFRIGILGSGFIVSDCHLVSYRKAGFNPVAIASRSRENAAKVAARHVIPTVYDSYEQLLADPTIEVLDIAVPPNAQLALIKQACARKTVKGILAQKPLGMNYREAVEAVECCEQAGIALAVNQNMRYDQSVRAAKTLLTNGTIGEPVFATIDMRGVPHFMPWQEELGWVTLRIMSIHHMDCLRYWFGDPEGIYCSTRPDPRTKFPHTDGICTYILEYQNGLRCVVIDDIWTGPAKEGCPADTSIKWRIEGLNGLAIGDIGWCKDPYTSPSSIRYAAKGDTTFHEPKWTESWFPDAFAGTMGQLLIALETKSAPAISGRDNLKTMALVEAAYKSAELFRSVELREIERGPYISSESAPPVENPEPIDIRSSLTPRAQQVFKLAREEAERFNSDFLGTEHLLLGLIKLGQGVAVNVLVKLGLDLVTVRAEVSKLFTVVVSTGKKTKIPYAPGVREILTLAQTEAGRLNHTYLGTEHLLLGLLQEPDGNAAKVMTNLGLNVAQVRTEILRELDPKFSQSIIFEKKPLAESETATEPSGKAPKVFFGPKKKESVNFTPLAQRVLSLANEEAIRLNHNFLGTEHLLLGIIRLGEGGAVNVLRKMGHNLDIIRAEVEKQTPRGSGKMAFSVPYTPRVKKVISLAQKQSEKLHHTHVGTEHLLVGLLLEGLGVAAIVLKNQGVKEEETIIAILREHNPNQNP